VYGEALARSISMLRIKHARVDQHTAQLSVVEQILESGFQIAPASILTTIS
jgi:hypothetical protein